MSNSQSKEVAKLTSDEPLLKWFYSTKNITGCALTVAAPILAITGVVAPPIALLLIPALYAVGALVAPGKKKVDLAVGLDAEDITRSLTNIREKSYGRVSPNIYQRIMNIIHTIDDILPKAHELGAGSPEMHILIRTATDYLPSTLQPYLALPRLYAEQKVIHDGKTSETILCEQLDIIIEKLNDIYEGTLESDENKILSNGTFLKEKFGTAGFQLPASATGTTSNPDF